MFSNQLILITLSEKYDLCDIRKLTNPFVHGVRHVLFSERTVIVSLGARGLQVFTLAGLINQLSLAETIGCQELAHQTNSELSDIDVVQVVQL